MVVNKYIIFNRTQALEWLNKWKSPNHHIDNYISDDRTPEQYMNELKSNFLWEWEDIEYYLDKKI